MIDDHQGGKCEDNEPDALIDSGESDESNDYERDNKHAGTHEPRVRAGPAQRAPGDANAGSWTPVGGQISGG